MLTNPKGKQLADRRRAPEGEGHRGAPRDTGDAAAAARHVAQPPPRCRCAEPPGAIAALLSSSTRGRRAEARRGEAADTLPSIPPFTSRTPLPTAPSPHRAVR